MFIKVEDGLLEENNFLITTPLFDFLGKGQFSRTNDIFTLKSGKVERNFIYNEFVIEIEKEDTILDLKDKHIMYCKNDSNTVGLSEETGDPDEKYWKIILQDNYLQTYKSQDSKEWSNMGGIPWNNNLYQGFEVIGEKPMIIKKYAVYKNPYITIQNFTENTKVQLVDASDNLIKERIFDTSGTVQIYLDYCTDGKLVFFNAAGNEILKTGVLHFKYGDVYMQTEYELQMEYKQNPIGWETTNLDSYQEHVEITNLSDIDYSNLHVMVVKPTNNTDNILISLDDVDYTQHLVIENLLAHETKEIYIKIERDVSKLGYSTRDFELEVF